MRIEHVVIQMELAFLTEIGLLGSLSLLELLAVVFELVHQQITLLNLLQVIGIVGWNLLASFSVLLLSQVEMLSLLWSKQLIMKGLRSEVWGRDIDLLWSTERPGNFDVLRQELVYLSHLVWIQLPQTEKLLSWRVFLFLIVKRSLLLGGRLILRHQLELLGHLASFGFLHVWTLHLLWDHLLGSLLLILVVKARLLRPLGCSLSSLGLLPLESSLSLLVQFDGLILLLVASSSASPILDFLEFDVVPQLLVLLPLVFVHLALFEHAFGVDLVQLLWSQAEVHILGLQVCMDHLAHSVEVVESNEALLGHLPNDRDRSSFVVVSLDDLQQIAAEDLEHGHKVLSVRAVVQEAVQQLNTVAVVARDVGQLLWVAGVVVLQGIEPLRLHPVGTALVEDLNLIESGFQVLRGRSLDLNGHVSVVLQVFGQPHR